MQAAVRDPAHKVFIAYTIGRHDLAKTASKHCDVGARKRQNGNLSTGGRVQSFPRAFALSFLSTLNCNA